MWGDSGLHIRFTLQAVLTSLVSFGPTGGRLASSHGPQADDEDKLELEVFCNQPWRLSYLNYQSYYSEPKSKYCSESCKSLFNLSQK